MNSKEKEREKNRINHYLSIIEPRIGASGILNESSTELALAEIQATFKYKEGIMDALIEMVISGPFNYDELTMRLNAPALSRPAKSYLVYMPLSFQFESEKAYSFKIGKTEFTMYPKDSIPNKDDFINMKLLERSIPAKMLPDNLDLSFIAFTVHGNKFDESLERGISDLQKFRSAFNYTFARYSNLTHISNTTTQNTFLFPFWMVFKEATWDAGFFVQSNMREAQILKYNQKQVESVVDFTIKLHVEGNKYKKYIADLLDLYNEARDLEYEKEAFLAYWRVLERLTLVKRSGGATGEVIRRLSILFQNAGFEHPPQGLLQYMADKRNLAVHDGDYDVTYNLGDINRFTVILLEDAIYMKEIIVDEDELDFIYKNINLRSSELKSLARSIKTIDLIKKRRLRIKKFNN